jgi:hypothetical protein
MKKWVKMFQSMASSIIKKPGGSIGTAWTPENTVRVQAIISGSPIQSACSHSAALYHADHSVR